MFVHSNLEKLVMVICPYEVKTMLYVDTKLENLEWTARMCFRDWFFIYDKAICSNAAEIQV